MAVLTCNIPHSKSRCIFRSVSVCVCVSKIMEPIIDDVLYTRSHDSYVSVGTSGNHRFPYIRLLLTSHDDWVVDAESLDFYLHSTRLLKGKHYRPDSFFYFFSGALQTSLCQTNQVYHIQENITAVILHRLLARRVQICTPLLETITQNNWKIS